MDEDSRAFFDRIKKKIEETAGQAVDLELDEQDRARITIDLEPARPKLIFGADALKYPGLARMFIQYSLLCLKERRQVAEDEFILHLRRN